MVGPPIRRSLSCNEYFSIKWLPLAAEHHKPHQIQTKDFYLYPLNFRKILVWKYCVTSFICRRRTNLTLFALQWPILNHMSTHGSQTSQITSSSNWKPLSRSKDLSENLSFKLLVTSAFSRLFRHFLLYNVQFSTRSVNIKSNSN